MASAHAPAPVKELSLTITAVDDFSAVWLIQLSGPVGATTFDRLDAAIHKLFEEGHTRLVIDMSDVGYVSSSGAGVFMNAMTYAQDVGGRVILFGVSQSVFEIFELLSLNNILSFARDKEAALQMMK